MGGAHCKHAHAVNCSSARRLPKTPCGIQTLRLDPGSALCPAKPGTAHQRVEVAVGVASLLADVVIVTVTWTSQRRREETWRVTCTRTAKLLASSAGDPHHPPVGAACCASHRRATKAQALRGVRRPAHLSGRSRRTGLGRCRSCLCGRHTAGLLGSRRCTGRCSPRWRPAGASSERRLGCLRWLKGTEALQPHHLSMVQEMVRSSDTARLKSGRLSTRQAHLRALGPGQATFFTSSSRRNPLSPCTCPRCSSARSGSRRWSCTSCRGRSPRRCRRSRHPPPAR